jgi:hypothetical protein
LLKLETNSISDDVDARVQGVAPPQVPIPSNSN